LLATGLAAGFLVAGRRVWAAAGIAIVTAAISAAIVERRIV
jgi:hypothetical protein